VKIEDARRVERMAVADEAAREAQKEADQRSALEHYVGTQVILGVVVGGGLSAAIWTSSFTLSSKIALQTVIVGLAVYRLLAWSRPALPTANTDPHRRP
jgi:RNA 3'-terminal phosphate cyclase